LIDEGLMCSAYLARSVNEQRGDGFNTRSYLLGLGSCFSFISRFIITKP
jgi:hypothetical protein